MIRSLVGRGLACCVVLGLVSPGAVPLRAGFDGESCLGSFEEPIRVGGTNGVRFVVAADLDAGESPRTDVITASFGDNRITWFRQDLGRGGQPIFTRIDITADAHGATAVHVADLDASCDADQPEVPCLDLLSSSANDDKIAWYRNNGRPSPKFEELEISGDADLAQSVFAADINGDCNPESPGVPCLDVLSASYLDNKIAWYENDGAQPPAFTEHVISTAALGASSVYAADLDDDGDVDVVSASLLDDKVAWYENDGADPPQFVERIISIRGMTFVPEWEAGTRPLSVIVADLNGDCDPQNPAVLPCLDVVVAFNGDGAGTGKIAWFKNDGNADPAFSPEDIGDAVDLVNGRQVFALDMDGDMDQDVLAVYGMESAGDTIAWFRNDGQPAPAFTSLPVTDAKGAQSAYAADLNADGYIDVQSAASVPGQRIRDDEIAWHESSQTPEPTYEKNIISMNAATPESIAVEDLDADGDLDVVSASSGDSTIAWHESDGGVEIEGVLQPPRFRQWNIDQSADAAFFVFVADLDADCNPPEAPAAPCLDVISTSAGDGTDGKIVWYPNLGAPGPGQPEGPPLDFGYEIILERGAGTEPFAPAIVGDPDPPAESLDVRPMTVFAADIDRDSTPDTPVPCLDVIAAIRVEEEGVPDRVVWFENDGNALPGFEVEHEITTVLEGPHGVYSADLDSDGYMDVLVASTTDDRITWFRNRLGDSGAETPWQEIAVSYVADGAMWVAVADLDGDCPETCPEPPCYCLEVITASSADDTIAWYEIEYPTQEEGTGPAVIPDAVNVPAPAAAVLGTEPFLEVDKAELDFGDVFAGQVELAELTLTIKNDAEEGGEDLVITSIASTTANFAPSVTEITLEPQQVEPITVVFEPTDVAFFEGTLEFTSNAVNTPSPTVAMVGAGIQFVGHVVATDRDFARFVSAGDVDDDGNLDILAASGGDGVIAAYLQQVPDPEAEDQTPTFEELIVSAYADNARTALVTDLNADGKPDVATAFFFEIAWHPGGVIEDCNTFDADEDGLMSGAELAWIWSSFGESIPPGQDPDDPNDEWWAPVDYNSDGLIDGDDLAICASTGIWIRYVSPAEGEPAADGPLCNYSCVTQESHDE